MTDTPERVWVWPDMGLYKGEEMCVNNPLVLDPVHSPDLVEYIRADLCLNDDMREQVAAELYEMWLDSWPESHSLDNVPERRRPHPSNHRRAATGV